MQGRRRLLHLRLVVGLHEQRGSRRLRHHPRQPHGPQTELSVVQLHAVLDLRAGRNHLQRALQGHAGPASRNPGLPHDRRQREQGVHLPFRRQRRLQDLRHAQGAAERRSPLRLQLGHDRRAQVHPPRRIGHLHGPPAVRVDRLGRGQQQLPASPEHPLQIQRRQDAGLPRQRGRHPRGPLRRHVPAAGPARPDLRDDHGQKPEDALDVEDLAGVRPETAARLQPQHRGNLQQGHRRRGCQQARPARSGRRHPTPGRAPSAQSSGNRRASRTRTART